MTSLTGASGEDFASILRSLGYRMERRPKPAEPAESQAGRRLLPNNAGGGDGAERTAEAEAAAEAAAESVEAQPAEQEAGDRPQAEAAVSIAAGRRVACAAGRRTAGG